MHSLLYISAPQAFTPSLHLPPLTALLLFAEHRYYGVSKPFDTVTPTPEQLQWLTMEQVGVGHADGV
jgi:hypothetical protein